jgi:hypothetical protein
MVFLVSPFFGLSGLMCLGAEEATVVKKKINIYLGPERSLPSSVPYPQLKCTRQRIRPALVGVKSFLSLVRVLVDIIASLLTAFVADRSPRTINSPKKTEPRKKSPKKSSSKKSIPANPFASSKKPSQNKGIIRDVLALCSH